MSNTSLLGAFGGQAGDALMFRNRIINGGFDVWQRSTSHQLTGVAGYFTADRWYISSGGAPGVMTSSRQESGITETAYFNSRYYYRHNQTTGNNSNGRLHQFIESVWTLAGQTATLSFWIKSSKNLSVAVSIVQGFGSGGTPATPVVVLNQTISTTTIWTKFTFTVQLPSVVGKTLGTDGKDALNIMLDFPGSDTYIVDVAEVQMEAGPTATPFERRPIGTELALAQRYYYRLYSSTAFGPIAIGHCTGTTAANLLVNFPVTMRVPPASLDSSAANTFQLSDGVTAITCTSIGGSGTQITTNTSYLGAGVASGLTTYRPIRLEGANNSSAYVGFSAEL